MNRKWILGLGAVLIVLLSSCEFFTNSWAENLARDPGTITVTADNVDELLFEALGDTKASRGILNKLKGTKDPKLQAAAVKAANQAGGLDAVILESIGPLMDDDIPDEDSLNAMLTEIQNKTKGNDLVGISQDITATLPVSSGNPPQFTGNFNASEADLTFLALTLVLAEGEKAGGFTSYIENWGSSSSKKIDGTGLTSSERVIAAIANKVMADPNSTLGEMLDGLLGD
jgi:hypothetical protein